MSQLVEYPNSTQDDRLADFTDQISAGRLDEPDANADEELLALEETVLRLKKAFPPAALDPSAMKQMQVRFKTRARREAQEVKQHFWKRWFEPQSRPQFAIAFTAMALLILFAVFAPATSTAGSSTSATALTPMKNTFVVVALAGILLVLAWIKRRK